MLNDILSHQGFTKWTVSSKKIFSLPNKVDVNFKIENWVCSHH